MLTRQYSSHAIQHKIKKLEQLTNCMKNILVYRELSMDTDTGEQRDHYADKLFDNYRTIEALKREIDFDQIVDSDKF